MDLRFTAALEVRRRGARGREGERRKERQGGEEEGGGTIGKVTICAEWRAMGQGRLRFNTFKA